MCQQCEQLADLQWKAKDQEQNDWRDVYRMHLFFQHHNPSVFVGDVDKYEMPEMQEESKDK